VTATADRQRVFDALASPIRREILWLTWREERTVGDIATHFAVSAPTLSSHLTVLRNAGLVDMRADGNFRRYRCNRDAVGALVPLLASSDERWVQANAIPETDAARATTSSLVTVSVDVPIDQATAFDAFTDDRRYSDWLGVPVRIDGRSFAATLEWGTQIRGHYDVVARPDLIAMTWDFEDDTVPLPGHQLVAYLRVIDRGREGCTVTVQQPVDDDAHVAFLTTAWSLVLGRFATASTRDGRARHRRARRPKRA
jgi:DNA-binding transcriptional ArsR family regulator/uncharacterized protein YndB with AHSA1/START domain